MRKGAQYLKALDDDRYVFVHGERTKKIAEHPGFRGIAATMAKLYDTAADPAQGMQYLAPETGEPANRVFAIPRSREDLATRRAAILKWARITHGLVGRSPDHVGSFLAGFASHPAFFDGGARGFGANVKNFYKKLLSEDLYLSYVIIPPQIDRSKTASTQEEAFLQAGVVKERDDGIVIRGAQMLGTGAAVSDWLFVSCIVPQQPGDEPYANTFVLPVSTPGLKLYCRPPYALHKERVYDYPLSTRFDESDALAVFDDVFVPWEQVFVYRDLEKVRAQFFATPAHVLGNNQAQIRFTAKIQFLVGLARKIAAANGVDKIPGVIEKLGELASLASVVEGMELASEAASTLDPRGVARPNERFLYGAMGLQAELYPRALQALRELAGGGPLQVPSSVVDLEHPEAGADLRRYIRSPGSPAEEKIKLFKLAWDLIGTEFGGRHLQYEMFYAGAPFVAKGYAFRNYGYEQATQLVDAALNDYKMETAVNSKQ